MSNRSSRSFGFELAKASSPPCNSRLSMLWPAWRRIRSLTNCCMVGELRLELFELAALGFLELAQDHVEAQLGLLLVLLGLRLLVLLPWTARPAAACRDAAAAGPLCAACFMACEAAGRRAASARPSSPCSSSPAGDPRPASAAPRPSACCVPGLPCSAHRSSCQCCSCWLRGTCFSSFS